MKLAIAAAIVALSATIARAQSSPFELGVQRFQAEDFAGAIPLLEQAHAAAPRDADTALLLGIAYFRVDRPDDARPLLEQAEAHGDADSKASARVFLGLIADRAGESQHAREYYALVAQSPTSLGASGRLLLDQNGPERWSAVAIAQPGYDSNPALQPATAAAPPGPGRGNGGGGTGDAELSLIGAVTLRPTLAAPLVLDSTILYRAYAQDTAYDMLADATGATFTLAGASQRATLAYHFNASTLGGARYELAHVADAAYRHALAGDYGLGVRYTFAARDYAQAAYAGYTGLYHTAGADFVWGSPGAPSEGTLGYVFEREAADDTTLASYGNGARGELHARLGRDADLRASALAIHRVFDAASMGRVDTQVRGDLALYFDTSASWGFVIGTSLVRNASNDPDFDYTKWTAYAGLIATAAP